MRTRRVFVRQKHPLHRICRDLCSGSRALRNTACFYQRNLMTGLAKPEAERTQNEKDVIRITTESLIRANAEKIDRFVKKVVSSKNSKGRRMKIHAEIRAALMKALSPFPIPEKGRWLLSYEAIDAVMKLSRNESYYALPSQANQQILKKCVSDWNSWIESLKAWKEDPSKFTGKPNMPGYVRKTLSTAALTNQICKYAEDPQFGYVSFPRSVELLRIGLPLDGKYVRTEIKPAYGGFYVLVVYDEKDKKKEVPNLPDKGRKLGVDVGTVNFLTCAGNFGDAPFIIDGRYLKSLNQEYNKEKARLTSRLTKGVKPKKRSGAKPSENGKKTPTYAEKTGSDSTRMLDALSLNRDNRFRDVFYKSAHYLCRYCVEKEVNVIVVTHNEGQKQGIHLGHVNDQNFAYIAFSTFIFILRVVAYQYGVSVIVREESYTSKADFLSGDEIPTYKAGEKVDYRFSGKRVKRGLYESGAGVFINADVNGAVNVLRKEFPDAFSGIADFSYLYGTVRRISMEEIIHVKQNRPKKNKSKKETRSKAA